MGTVRRPRFTARRKAMRSVIARSCPARRAQNLGVVVAPRGYRALVAADSLGPFSPAVREWFDTTFGAPTDAQAKGWPAIAAGEHTLILAPTGSGKTLAAFLWAIDRLVTDPVPEKTERTRVLYLSPIKALAVD